MLTCAHCGLPIRSSNGFSSHSYLHVGTDDARCRLAFASPAIETERNPS